jgi:hypothetical protein
MMGKPYLTEDGLFSAPVLVHDLNDVPEQFRGMYTEATHAPGKFVLTQEGRKLKEWYLGEIERTHSEGKAGIADREAKLQKAKKESEDFTIERALTFELTEQGCIPGLMKAAVALLKEQYSYEIEGFAYGDGIIVMARNEFGLSSIEAAVRGLLESEGGAAFRNRSAAPSDAYFTRLLADLRRPR